MRAGEQGSSSMVEEGRCSSALAGAAGSCTTKLCSQDDGDSAWLTACVLGEPTMSSVELGLFDPIVIALLFQALLPLPADPGGTSPHSPPAPPTPAPVVVLSGCKPASFDEALFFFLIDIGFTLLFNWFLLYRAFNSRELVVDTAVEDGTERSVGEGPAFKACDSRSNDMDSRIVLKLDASMALEGGGMMGGLQFLSKPQEMEANHL